MPQKGWSPFGLLLCVQHERKEKAGGMKFGDAFPARVTAVCLKPLSCDLVPRQILMRCIASCPENSPGTSGINEKALLGAVQSYSARCHHGFAGTKPSLGTWKAS